MNWFTQPIIAALPIIMAVGLIAIVGLLAVIAFRREPQGEVVLGFDIEAMIADIEEAAAHHADISAVIELVRQLDESPASAEALADYPASVAAAALAHRADQLGHMIQFDQQEALRHEERDSAHSADRCLKRAAELQKQLEALPAAAKRLRQV